MIAEAEVYQGSQDDWTYRIFKNDFGKWVAFRWKRARPVFITQEWFTQDGFVKDRSIKSNDQKVSRFETAEDCENELLMLFATDKLSG
jgi:hypothetical protein